MIPAGLPGYHRRHRRANQGASEASLMTRTSQRGWLRAEPPLILAILLTYLFQTAPGIELHPDESQRIYSSRILEAVLDGRFDSPLFESTFFTRTVMPVPQYLIGLGRRFGGASLDDLAAPWSFSRSHEENVLRGSIPSETLLYWSRAPMLLLTALCGLMVCLLCRRMGGRFSGYVGLALFTLNPYIANTLCLAMAETPLLASTLAAIGIGAWTLERAQLAGAERPATRRELVTPMLGCIALGVMGGVAGASKLNGASVVAGGTLLILMIPLVDDPRLSARRARFALLGAGASFASGLVTFFALNPFFYRNPARRVSELIPALLNSLERRRAEGLGDIIDPDERRGLIVDRVFQSCSALSFDHAAMLNGILFAIGLASVLTGVRAWLRGRDSGPSAATCTAFTVIGVFAVVPTLTTPLDWERYFILPVVLSSICIAQAAGMLARRGLSMARGR
jgi:hypothetical protein